MVVIAGRGITEFCPFFLVGEKGVGHRFATAVAPVDPGSAPSCLRHSTLLPYQKKCPQILRTFGHFSGGREGSRTLISLRTKDFKSFVYTIPPLARGLVYKYLAPPEGVGHRFVSADTPVDPGSAPSCLRHSTLVTQAKFVGTKSPPNFPGAPGGSRTPNLFLRRELLYPLSYEGIATLYLYYQTSQNSTIILNCFNQKKLATTTTK